MPGANCAMPLCGTCRNHKTVSIFQITSRKGDFYEQWRKNLINELYKYRVPDKSLKQRSEEGKLYLCELHFKNEDIEFTKTGKKTLRLGALPTQNLPRQTLSSSSLERKHRNIVDNNTHFKNVQPNIKYKSLSDLRSKISALKLNGWTYTFKDNELSFEFYEHPFKIAKYEVIVDDSLGYTCLIFGSLLPDDHQIYKTFKRSLKKTTISQLLHEILQYIICEGLNLENNQELKIHSVPCKINRDENNPMEAKIYRRSKMCHLIIENVESLCCHCKSFEKKEKKKRQQQSKTNDQPAKRNAPLSKTSANRIKLALQQERIKCRQLESEFNEMKKHLKNDSVKVNSTLDQDLITIMSSSSSKISPFMKLFWSEQTKLFNSSSTSRKYHPMIIRFCLSLASKSAIAYDELRDANILTLPSRRTLRDYKNVIKPSTGFNPDVVTELTQLTSNLKGPQRYVVLSFDEMKIQSNLIFNKYSNDLIGYVDLGDPDLNYGTFQDINELASHVLVFYVRGIASDLKYSLAYFATNCVTSYQIFTSFWRAVLILELSCNLKVLATVSDGAAPNRKFFKMHAPMNSDDDNECTYRTKNLFAPSRFIWFFSDAPHLMKTARNCMYHSDFSHGSRKLWNDGHYILWKHVVQIVQDDLKHGLKRIPKLTTDHVYLTSFSAMDVSKAVQVLSHSTSRILQTYYTEDTKKTAELCEMMNHFFDCLNVRNRIEGDKKRNPFLKPYTNMDDMRFTWLKETFIKFLDDWKSNIETRGGQFTKSQ